VASRFCGFTRYVAVVLTFGLLLARHAAAAQGVDGCTPVQGNWLDTLKAVGGTTGNITRAGFLNGTTQTVYSPAFALTPDPNVVSYTAVTTITTAKGLLVTNNVYLYNFVTGVGTALGTIDGNTSSGRFGGATGTLFYNTNQTLGVFPNQSYNSTIAGTVCFASD